MINLTDEQLNKRNTRGLLYFLKKVRRKIIQIKNNIWCPCCGEMIESESSIKISKRELKKYENLFNRIKKVLSTREHIDRKPKRRHGR